MRNKKTETQAIWKALDVIRANKELSRQMDLFTIPTSSGPALAYKVMAYAANKTCPIF
jgi:hypothetical protein